MMIILSYYLMATNEMLKLEVMNEDSIRCYVKDTIKTKFKKVYMILTIITRTFKNNLCLSAVGVLKLLTYQGATECIVQEQKVSVLYVSYIIK